MLVMVVGKACSGKTSLRKEFEKMGYLTVEASEYYRNSAKKNSLGLNIHNLPLNILTASEIISQYGWKLNHSILTGTRTVEEYECFCRYNYHVYLVALRCENRVCYERAKNRNRETFNSYEEFIEKRIVSDNKLGLGRLMDQADLILDNQGKQVQAFLEKGIETLRPYVEK